MNLITDAWNGLFDKEFPYESKLKYSGHFKGYNANMRLSLGILTVNMSKQWKGISNEIQIGLIQDMMVRMFKIKKHTEEMELYSVFLKKVHLIIPKTQNDPYLDLIFKCLNEDYFFGVMDQPNLKWGEMSTTKLGSYDFGTDTISISRILHPDNCSNTELLSFVLYHELLHKKHQFKSKYGKNRTHTGAFRTDEKAYPNSEQLEKELGKHCKKLKRKKWF